MSQVTLRNIWITMSALCSGTGMQLKVYNKSTAACDGKFMYMPKHWVYTTDPAIHAILLGITVHEAMGHGRYTDFVQYKDYAVTLSQMGSSILNIFEDIYIETQCNKAKPGASIALAEMVTTLTSNGFFGTPQNFVQSAAANPASIIVSGLLILCRARLLPGQDIPLAKNAAALEVMLDAMFGNLWLQIWDIAKNAANSTCTEDSINLTKQVLALIAQQAADQPPQPKQKQKKTDNQEQSDESNGEMEPADQPEDPGDSGEEDEAQCDDAAMSSSDPENSVKSFEDGEPDSQSESSDGDPSSKSGNAGKSERDATEKAKSQSQEKVREAAKAIYRCQNQVMPTTEVSEMASKEVAEKARDCRDGTMTLNTLPHKRGISEAAVKIATAVKSISDDLQDALLAETRCVRSNRIVGKRLNSRLLSRVCTGNPNVFIRKDIGSGLSTAVSLLIDDSGSMGNLSDWTNGLSFGLGDILDEFEVPMEIAVFSDELAYAKNFEDDWTNFRKQRKMVSIGGGTSTGGATELVLGAMACRNEERRLLIIATDGDTSDMDRLESAYAEATHQGIEIASVMLGTVIPKIQRLANKFGFEAVSCTNEKDLARYVLGRILEAI